MPDGSVEVDADLPEGGPGTIEGRLYYDPSKCSGRVAAIEATSSGGGGPQSVNWAYETDSPLTISGVDSDPIVGRAWVDEDIGFGWPTPRPATALRSMRAARWRHPGSLIEPSLRRCHSAVI